MDIPLNAYSSNAMVDEGRTRLQNREGRRCQGKLIFKLQEWKNSIDPLMKPSSLLTISRLLGKSSQSRPEESANSNLKNIQVGRQVL
jgi:hypothetical protein